MDKTSEHFAEEWLAKHGDLLYSYALSRLGGNAAVAEDLVQETLLAGIEGFANFQRKAKVETWLVGILRRKLIDHFRRSYRSTKEVTVAQFFSNEGHIKDIDRWGGDPQKAFEDDEFWEIFDQCLSKLSAPLAEVFVICVMDDVDTKEACRQLDVTSTNLSVRLHRARLGLRECLQNNWFRRE